MKTETGTSLKSNMVIITKEFEFKVTSINHTKIPIIPQFYLLMEQGKKIYYCTYERAIVKIKNSWPPFGSHENG